MDLVTTGLRALRQIPTIELAPLLGIPLYWMLGMGLFALRCSFRGMPHTERIAKASSRAMPRFILEYGWWMLRLPVRVLLRLHVSPNAITVMSLLAAVAAGFGFAMGRFAAGGWLLALSAACDSLDGTIARETGVASDRGEYFDAVVDRYSDFAISFGLLYYYRNDGWPAALVAGSIIGSQAMGYAKAKGEAVGVDPKIGWMQRHERCIYMVVATVFAPIVGAFVEPLAAHPTFHLTLAGIALIAVFTNLTAVARATYVMEHMPAPPPATTAGVAVALPLNVERPA